jgi:hypothetical protein
MIGQILQNNNEKYYNNFSSTFHPLNTPSSACFSRAALGALTGLVVPWWVPPFLPVDSFLQLVSPTALQATALFCWSGFGLFQLVLAYSLSQNTIESAKTSRLFYLPNQSYSSTWHLRHTPAARAARWAKTPVVKSRGGARCFYLNPPSLIRPGQKSFTPWVIGP